MRHPDEPTHVGESGNDPLEDVAEAASDPGLPSRHPADRVRELWAGFWRRLSPEQRRRWRDSSQRRQRNTQVLVEQLRILKDRLPAAGRRRLAAHRLVVIPCADIREVEQWQAHFGIAGRSRSAMVVSQKPPQGGAYVVLVINGGDTRQAAFLHLHELAHLIDRGPDPSRISDTAAWQRLAATHRAVLGRKRLIPADVPPPQEAKEAFASALAWTWLNPDDARRSFPQLVHFFVEANLFRND